MSAWEWSAAGLLLCLAPCAWVVCTGKTMDRLAALELSGTLSVLFILVLSMGFQQPSFVDLSLTLALLGLPGGLVFAYFFERWL